MPFDGAHIRGKLARHDRPQLHDRVVAAPLHATGPDDDSVLVQRQVGRVEEEDLADLCLEGIHAEGAHGRSVMLLRDRQLELRAVGAVEEGEQLLQLFVR